MRKNVVLVIGMVLFVGNVGCIASRGYLVVSADRMQDNKYRTFSFPEVSELQNSTIEGVIKTRFELQGYRQIHQNPDFMVSYILFYGNPVFYNQPVNGSRSMYSVPGYDSGNGREEAALLVLLSDYQTGAVFFQSYVKRIHCDPTLHNDIRLRSAIHLLLNRYRHFAPGNFHNRAKA